LIQQLDPDEVDAKYSNWKMEHLPIVPETWKMKQQSQVLVFVLYQLTIPRGILFFVPLSLVLV
jgi:DNA topoisomerase-3